MKYKEPRPRWGWLYAIFGLMLVLFYVEAKMAWTGGMRPWAQMGVIVIIVILTDLWIGSNLPFDKWS